MMDLGKAILPALIALAGTLIVCTLGYRQWRRNHAMTRYGSFLSERLQAYKTSWEMMEEVHTYVRSEQFQESRFNELVRALNMHLIRVGLHLDHGEKERINAYVKALEQLGRALLDDRAAAAKSETYAISYTTGNIPEDLLEQVEGLKSAYDSVEEKRKSIITHFRTVLGAREVL